MATALRLPRTLDEFLDWEERQPRKWEFVGCRPRLMAGGTITHDRIANNIRGLLFAALRGRRCSAHGPDLKVLSPAGTSTYPDAIVLCDERDGRRTTCDDPTVVVEVLSESTAKDDLTRKRRAYQAIPSLRVIVYASQDEPRLDIVRRQPDGRWEDDEPVEGLEGALALPEVGVTLAMAEIYEDTEVGRAERSASA